MSADVEIILQLTSPDRPGVLATTSAALAADGWNIRDAVVYGCPDTGVFFVRIAMAGKLEAQVRLADVLAPVGASQGIAWSIHEKAMPMRVMIAVSRFDHCLTDLIHKTKIGSLPIDIVGVVSNHEDSRALVEWHGLSFHHLPISAATKPAQEAVFKALFADSGAELLVLARYMQVLSTDLAAHLSGRCINIHHSFLPSFKGAKPYHQAHAGGVKLIGATAHYVTADLDEGPIIEQDIRRVTHATTAAEMVAIGRETEASVLSRAVRWHAEHRVALNGHRTIVFA